MTFPTLKSLHPPKPRFGLSIGIVGHRPNRLSEQGRKSIEMHLSEALCSIIKSADAAQSRHAPFFADAPASLVLISALAEGADRMAAHAAIQQGLSLAAVLPFLSSEYEDDFAEISSRYEYREFLAKSQVTLELGGDRVQEARAYETAGLTILDNSDILLAVWDGGASAGRGGTTEMVEWAARKSIPVIHIDATGEHAARLLRSGPIDLPITEIADLPAVPIADGLDEVVDRIVRPPSGAERTKLFRFLGEVWRTRNWRLEVPLLLGLLGIRQPRWSDLEPAPPDALAAEFVRQSGEPGRQSGAGGEAFAAAAALAFGWADALATHYAQVFRGAYIANFVLAALSVLMAAASLVGAQIIGWPKWPFVLLEIAFIGAVITNTAVGRRREWHGRWLETREVAERFRAGLLTWLVGQTAKTSSGGEPTWTGWYTRAQFRAMGIRSEFFDDDRLSKTRDTISAILDDQCRYHTANADRMHRVEHRVERVGMALFVLTLAIAILYVLGVASGLPSPSWWSYVVTALTAGLPALAAATYGIRLIGDFAGVAKRSQRTGEALHTINKVLQREPPSLAGLRILAGTASDAMLGDVSHWRLAAETRGLAIPG